MSEAKKNVPDLDVNGKIQKRFDKVFENSDNSTLNTTTIQPKQQQVQKEVQAKVEVIDLDLDTESSIDLIESLSSTSDSNAHLTAAPSIELKKTKLNENEINEMTIEFSNIKDKDIIVDANQGLDNNENATTILKEENPETLIATNTDLDLVIDEIILLESTSINDATGKTIIFDRSQLTETRNNIEDKLDEDLTSQNNLSAEIMTTEEARSNMEMTIKDILKVSNLDFNQEIDATGGSEQNIFQKDIEEDTNQIENMTFDLGSKLTESGSSEFDLNSVEFTNKEINDQEVTFNFNDTQNKDNEVSEISSTSNEYFISQDVPPPIQSINNNFNKSESAIPFSAVEETRFHSTIRQLREEREDLINQIKKYKTEAKEVEQDNLTLKAALDESKIEISILRKRHLVEIEDMKYRVSLNEEKRAIAEERAKLSESKREKLEQKVRIDFNQVKLREKELETKLEMLSIDIDSQVHSRDQKILELRRKIDALEFNMENVSIRDQKSQDDKRKVEDKLNKIMKTLRYSIKNLEDDIDQAGDEIQEIRKNDDRSKA